MSEIQWRDVTDEYKTPTQETQMTETTQELPAVSKLKEAFEVARNAIIDGSELAKVVENLKTSVASLNDQVISLQRDLEYVRNRNRELDEQVTQVRQSRDSALMDAALQEDRADKAEAEVNEMVRGIDELRRSLSSALDRTDAAKRERDDAMTMALEYETKLKAAEAKLAKIEEVFGIAKAEVEKPKPHYETQPRDEVGKFQPTAYDRGSQSEGSGF